MGMEKKTSRSEGKKRDVGRKIGRIIRRRIPSPRGLSLGEKEGAVKKAAA